MLRINKNWKDMLLVGFFDHNHNFMPIGWCEDSAQP